MGRPTVNGYVMTAAERARRYRVNHPGRRPTADRFDAVVGHNSHLIAEVASLYLRPGMVVCDVSFGKGTFWQKVDTTKFDFRPSDLCPEGPARRLDFRKLPYADGTVDVAVLDPPYTHHPESLRRGGPYREAVAARYRSHTTAGHTHADIITLYRQGMAEACRVLRPHGGQLWVNTAS
jgi:hypothetical protein